MQKIRYQNQSNRTKSLMTTFDYIFKKGLGRLETLKKRSFYIKTITHCHSKNHTGSQGFPLPKSQLIQTNIDVNTQNETARSGMILSL